MTRRIALAPGVTREAFQRAATRRGWLLHNVVEASTSEPYEQIWSIGGGTSAAHYIEDPLLRVAYVLAMGSDEDLVSSQVAEDLNTVDVATAAAKVKSGATKEERLRGLEYLAAAAPPQADAELIDALSKALGDSDPEIRRIAVFVSTYPAWPELDALLQRTAASDPDPALRAAADQALAAIRRHRNGRET